MADEREALRDVDALVDVGWSALRPARREVVYRSDVGRILDAVLAVLPSGDGPLREALRALADKWADQPTDYDEDTEQQIADGKELRALLAESEPTS